LINVTPVIGIVKVDAAPVVIHIVFDVVIAFIPTITAKPSTF
jgi:hypothetical protein